MCENSCKALWGLRVVVLWIGGGRGEGIRHRGSWLGMTCDGREAHCHTHEQRLSADTYKSGFSHRVCFSWLVTWNRVNVTHCVSQSPTATREDRLFPAPTFFTKPYGYFATIYLYFCVKTPGWPKVKWGVFLLMLVEILVIFKLQRVLLLPWKEFHLWQYAVWRTEGNKVQGKSTRYLLNCRLWGICPPWFS